MDALLDPLSAMLVRFAGYLIEMDGSTNKDHWKVLHDVKPDIYVIGRSGLFNLTDNIESSWQQMVAEFEEATGEKFIQLRADEAA